LPDCTVARNTLGCARRDGHAGRLRSPAHAFASKGRPRRLRRRFGPPLQSARHAVEAGEARLGRRRWHGRVHPAPCARHGRDPSLHPPLAIGVPTGHLELTPRAWRRRHPAS